MLQLFIASFCDQTDIEGNGSNMTNAKKLKQQALLKLKKKLGQLCVFQKVWKILLSKILCNMHFHEIFFINYSYLYNWSNKEMRCSLFQNIFQLTVQTLTKYSSVALLNWTSLSSRELLNIVYDLNFIQARV